LKSEVGEVWKEERLGLPRGEGTPPPYYPDFRTSGLQDFRTSRLLDPSHREVDFKTP